MSAYYNEFDPGAAAWLRELMKRGLIADGEVDDRSILEVQPDDLRGYTQCHFFAGIGVWSHALRQSGWADARPVWTASLPCQPFSAAGKQSGADDERNLAEVWLRLAAECRPAIAIGEQVEPAIGFGWLDAVFIRLEQADYACGAAVFPACSVGAPHIRSRLYWVAQSELAGTGDHARPAGGREREAVVGWGAGLRSGNGAAVRGGADAGITTDGAGVMGDAEQPGSQGFERPGDMGLHRGPGAHGSTATAGFWRDAIWLPCRDNKSRPTGRGIHPLVVADAKLHGREQQQIHRPAEGQQGLHGTGEQRVESGSLRAASDRQGPAQPGSFSLADGPATRVVRGGDRSEAFDADATAEARVMRLKGYGNAIVAPAAQAFIECYMET